MTLRNPLATHGISVIEPTSPEFTTEAQKFLAPSVFAKVAAYLSAGAILINNTVQYIWGFTVIYSYPNWYSASGRPHSIWLNPSAGIPSPPKSRMLPPGGSYLITPIRDILATRDGDGNVIHTPAFSADTSSSGVHLTSSVALDEILSDYAATQAQESVTMLLDSVIFEDGTIIGPDSKGRQQELNDRIRADCDLVGELALLSGDDLKQRLIYHAGSQRKGRYHERMTEASAILLDVLNNTDESRFRAELDAVRLEQWFGGSNQVRRHR